MTEPTVEEMANCFGVEEADCFELEHNACLKYGLFESRARCIRCIKARFTPTEIRQKYQEMKGDRDE